MANTDNPFGFQLLTPIKTGLVRIFPVATAYGTAIFKRDVVGAPASTTGYVCAALEGATLPGVEIVTAGVAGETYGVVEAVYDYNMLPLVYLPASTTGDSVVAGYVAVNCDPDAEYLVQEDGVTTPIAAASLGLNCDSISTHTGNTLTGIGKMELDSNTVADTVSLMFKVIRSWPGDTVGEANCRFVVKLNSAFWAPNVVGETT